jgi:ankyrin repeat protein
MNLAEITRLLVEAGADVNATAEMYGGGSTALGLLVTSDHPAKAGVTEDVRKVLVDAGAKQV